MTIIRTSFEFIGISISDIDAMIFDILCMVIRVLQLELWEMMYALSTRDKIAMEMDCMKTTP